MYQPTTLKIYTNGALYIEHRPSTKRIAFSEPETGALVRKILVADWSTLKNILKAEGRVIAAVLTASQRDIEADMALRRKKAPTQWVVLEHPDIVPLIKTKITTREAGILNLGSVPVRVTITDKQILLHLASAQNMPNVIQQVVDAANWDKLVDAVADACKDAAQVIQDNPADYKIAQELISETLADEIDRATTRALGAVDHFRTININYSKYEVTAAIKVSLSVVGIVAGVAGLALAPFTLGATTIIGCIGLWRSAIQLGDQLGQLSLEAEETGGVIAEQVISMLDAYEGAKTSVGVGEVGKEVAKVLLPTALIPTIRGVGGLLETFHAKTDGLEINANRLSGTLSQTTDAELTATRAFQQFLDDNNDALTAREKQRVGRIMTQIPLLRQQTARLIRDVEHLNTRVAKCRHYHEVLTAAHAALAVDNPTWAVVITGLIPLVTDIGLTAGGGIGGAMDSLGAVGEAGKTAADSIGAALGIGNDLNDIIGEAALEIKKRKG